MFFIEKRTFKNSRDLTLSAIFEGEDRNNPTVVMCHGFESSKEGTTRLLAEKVIKKGFNVFRFDFTGHGESEGMIEDIGPLEGFDDLKSAIKAFKLKDFGLYGSSFGGFVALLYAIEKPLLALALKAPVSNYHEVQRSNQAWLRTWANFFTDISENKIYKNAKNIICPVLIIHGDKDDVVSFSQSQRLIKSLGSKEKRLVIMKNMNHDIQSKDLEKTTGLIADFFNQTLL